jgi:hypothetical protein
MDVDVAMPGIALFTRVPFREYMERWTVPEPEWDLRGLAPATTGDTAVTGIATEPDLTTLFLPPPAPPPDTTTGELLPGTLGRLTQLTMDIGGYGELGGSWQRFEPCDPSLHIDCNPGLFPQIEPDVQFNVRVLGTITDRIHVNVDYD